VTVVLQFIYANASLCHTSKSYQVITADKMRLRVLSARPNPKTERQNYADQFAACRRYRFFCPISEVLKDKRFRVNEVPPGSALLGGDAVVFNHAGHFCATQAKCTHKQGLNEGKLDGSTVTCPWHGSQFNVCTGTVFARPGNRSTQDLPRECGT